MTEASVPTTPVTQTLENAPIAPKPATTGSLVPWIAAMMPKAVYILYPTVVITMLVLWIDAILRRVVSMILSHATMEMLVLKKCVILR